MKLSIICITLFILLLIICTVSLTLITETTRAASFYLERAIILHQNGDHAEACKMIQYSEALWSENQSFLCIFLTHEDIDSVVTEYARLQAHVRTEDYDDLYRTCSALIVLLRHIQEMQYPLLENIL